MKVNDSGYLKCLKKDRIRFLSEMQKLTPRAKNLLGRVDMQTLDGFYYHLFVKQDIKDFQDLQGSGINTEKELISFTRKFLDPQGKYDKLIDKFNNEYNRLSKYTKPILKLIGISLFETFYYKVVINREIIELGKYRKSKLHILEAQNFIESMSNFLIYQ